MEDHTREPSSIETIYSLDDILISFKSRGDPHNIDLYKLSEPLSKCPWGVFEEINTSALMNEKAEIRRETL